jgi:hypothetical protein
VNKAPTFFIQALTQTLHNPASSSSSSAAGGANCLDDLMINIKSAHNQ